MVLIVSLLLISAYSDGFYLPDTFNKFTAFVRNEEVIFQLYTRQNPQTYAELILNNDTSLKYFNEKHPTRFLIHGWMGRPDYLAQIKDDYLLVGDHNVIMVDWSSMAFDPFYIFAKNTVLQVGTSVALLIDYLVEKGNNLTNIHIIGHSLGAHVAGIAGNRINGTLQKITGLDPALPLFLTDGLDDRLDKSDANFVEVIHTSLLGLSNPLGHADFYPNQALYMQPGCSSYPLLAALQCSHIRSLDYFSESIVTKWGFHAYYCDNWKDFVQGKCLNNDVALMGEYTDPRSFGTFYLKTSPLSPYARGTLHLKRFFKFINQNRSNSNAHSITTV